MHIVNILNVKNTGFKDFIVELTEEEFDTVIIALNKGIQVNKEDYPDYANGCSEVIRVLKTYTYFQPERKIARIKIGANEFEYLYEMLSFWAGANDELDKNKVHFFTFSDCINDPNCKIWRDKD